LFLIQKEKEKKPLPIRKTTTIMIGGHGRIGDSKVNTLSCQDMLVLDGHCNLMVNSIKTNDIQCLTLTSSSSTLPLIITSNVTFLQDIALEKDLFIEGNIIAGSSGLLLIEGNVDITKHMHVGSGLHVKGDGNFNGNVSVVDKLCVGNVITAKNGLDVIGDMSVDGALTVVHDTILGGNLTVGGGTMVTGNVHFANIIADNLFVHAIYGNSPISLRSQANFLSQANFQQLVRLLGASLSVSLGGSVNVDDGNMTITKSPMSTAGQLHVSGGGDVMVSGGNVEVTGHNLTGKGSISVLDGGDINLRNGGSVVINDGGNVIVQGGGTVVQIDPMGMPQELAGTVPVGSILVWAGAAAAPTYFLLCNGQPVSRTTYAKLFDVIGTVYGMGDGMTTFNVPDLRQRLPIGQNTAGAPPFTVIGATGGSLTSSLATPNLPAHNHAVTDPGHAHGVSDPGHSHGIPEAAVSVSSFETYASATTTGINSTPATFSSTTGISIQSNTTGITTQNTGSGTAFATYPPILTMNYIIRAL
jgi:microcystin-dependent protein